MTKSQRYYKELQQIEDNFTREDEIGNIKWNPPVSHPMYKGWRTVLELAEKTGEWEWYEKQKKTLLKRRKAYIENWEFFRHLEQLQKEADKEPFEEVVDFEE